MEGKLRLVPVEPGIYLLKNPSGEILYIGKAASLKTRVRSYFQTSNDTKTQHLMREVHDFEYIITRTEREALLLEATLIKKHQPRYNIRLKDDKCYPYLKLTRERFPKLELVRQVESDGAKYFGPYTSGEMIREALKLLQRVFKLRTCNLQFEQTSIHKRPCLDYHIGLCDAPCVGWISETEYGRLIKSAELFLRGRNDELMTELRHRMEEASARLEFERAARLRDMILSLGRLFAGQEEDRIHSIERDVIGHAVSPKSHTACVQVFFMREGRLVGRESIFLDTLKPATASEILTAFVKQYYDSATHVPQEILLSCELDEPDAIAAWLSERRGGSVKLRTVNRGPHRTLLDLVAHNAELTLQERTVFTPKVPDEGALQELQDILQLERVPQRIEAYDISNFQGHEAVGSMVVFYDGHPMKSEYRRFKIKAVSGIDDSGMIAEVVRRRLEHARAGDARFLPLPDLMLIDGGKGQLRAAQAVMHKLGTGKIPTVALAKEFEHLFVERRAHPITLPMESHALHLIQRLRDEAHRFALSYHRTLRKGEFIKSALDEISGIGPKRKKVLMRKFGSLSALKQATLIDLQTILTPALARRLYRSLRTPSRSSTESLLGRTDGSSKAHH